MKNLVAVICVIGSSEAIAGAVSSRMLPIPYYDWNACPFECCTYREWEATDALAAHSQRTDDSPVAFSIRKSEKIRALTGVVITTHAGMVKLLAPSKLGYSRTNASQEPELDLKAGNMIYTLHYEGEGSYLFWYMGKTYSSGADDTIDGGDYKVVSQPTYVWWVKIRNKDGKTGWTKATDKFTNSDACG